MRLSIPVVENGALIAVAVQGDEGWYLIALDTRLAPLDRQPFAGSAAATLAARAAFRRRPAINASAA